MNILSGFKYIPSLEGKIKTMRKISLYIAASIDGYIARPNGSVEWLDEFPTPDNNDFGYHEFLKDIDTTIMGGATYRQVLTFGDWPYPDKDNFVLTRQLDLEHPNASFVNDDIVKFAKDLRERSGKGIWLIGGGEINSVFLQNDLIDEMILTVVPIVLGNGIPLFAKAEINKKLKLQKTETFENGMVQLTYTKN